MGPSRRGKRTWSPLASVLCYKYCVDWNLDLRNGIRTITTLKEEKSQRDSITHRNPAGTETLVKAYISFLW